MCATTQDECHIRVQLTTHRYTIYMCISIKNINTGMYTCIMCKFLHRPYDSLAPSTASLQSSGNKFVPSDGRNRECKHATFG